MPRVRAADCDSEPAAAPRAARALAGASALVAAALWLAQGTKPRLAPGDLEQSSVYDLVFYYAPNAALGAARLGRGELPLWNPQQALGGPFLATLQPALLYPASALQLLFEPAAAFALSVALHIALAAWFTARLSRALGAGGGAAALAGLVFATSLDVTANALVPPLVCATAWLPAVLLAALRCAERASFAASAALAAAIALQIYCGWPYLVAMTALATALFASGALLGSPRARRARALLALGAGAAAGGALAGPQLLPALELLPETTRALGSLSAAQALFADAPHDARLYAQRLLAQGSALGVPSALALLFALAALARPGPLRAPRAALAAAGALFFCASFPHSLPVYDALRALPLLGDFRFPFRYRSGAALCISVLAGVGLSHAASLAAARIAAPQRAAALRGALALAAAALAASRFGCAPLTPLRFPRELPHPPRLEDLLGPALGSALQTPESGSRSRLLWSGREGRLGAPAALDAAFDLEPFTLSRSARALGALAAESAARTGMARPGEPDPFARAPFYGKARMRRLAHARLLDALAIDLVAFDRPRDWHRKAFLPLSLGRPALYRNPGARPRAYRVARAEREPASVDAAIERLLDPAFDLAAQVMLDALPEAPAAEPAAGAGAPGSAQLLRYEPERVRVRTRGSEPGFLVLCDAWYPGWIAELDGARVRVLRANALFRAVAVPAGEHEVEFRYEPQSFRAGLAAAAAVLALGAAQGLRTLRRRRAPSRPLPPARGNPTGVD